MGEAEQKECGDTLLIDYSILMSGIGADYRLDLKTE